MQFFFLREISVLSKILYNSHISGYFDGTSYLDNCKSKLERRVTALSGLLISHQLYGSIPYNASKNCFLLITAPPGYRIRLRVLDFNVLGDAHNCDKDTLHVFDVYFILAAISYLIKPHFTFHFPTVLSLIF